MELLSAVVTVAIMGTLSLSSIDGEDSLAGVGSSEESNSTNDFVPEFTTIEESGMIVEQTGSPDRASTMEEYEVLLLFEENLGAMFNVEFDASNYTYNLYAIDQGFINDVKALEQGLVDDSWWYFTENYYVLSNEIYNALGYGYTLNLYNPFNEERVILSAVDGYPVYDINWYIH